MLIVNFVLVLVSKPQPCGTGNLKLWLSGLIYYEFTFSYKCGVKIKFCFKNGQIWTIFCSTFRTPMKQKS